MSTYEMMYIIKPAAEEAAQKEINDKIKAIIETNGGSQLSFESMGKKEIATIFDKETHGFYFLTVYEGPGKINSALKSYFKITENVLRHLILVLDKKALDHRANTGKKVTAAKKEKAVAAEENNENKEITVEA